MTTDTKPTAEPFTLPADTDLERGFLGCVLTAPHPVARRLLAGMRADDFAAPMAQLVAQLAIELVAEDHPPAPTAILARAATTGRVPALRDPAGDPNRPRDGGEQRYHQLALWLLETYRQPSWPGLGHYLKTSVIETAWRRAITEHATRLIQAAATSPADVLADLADDCDRITDLATRHRAELAAESDDPISHPTPKVAATSNTERPENRSATRAITRGTEAA